MLCSIVNFVKILPQQIWTKPLSCIIWDDGLNRKDFWHSIIVN